ncbi:coiled-coil domain-containing protein 18 [Nematolebias whitei]|uniref:coiled-coil domain-containing protein 18 n=1 Tax=Nematolebias whitei TaxID=451745 RepID=UPI001897FF5C|nr:coiled-coil domain-containing protein 18 [Nematolebias whitei]
MGPQLSPSGDYYAPDGGVKVSTLVDWEGYESEESLPATSWTRTSFRSFITPILTKLEVHVMFLRLAVTCHAHLLTLRVHQFLALLKNPIHHSARLSNPLGKKTKEIVVDFRRTQTKHAPLSINGVVVERVSSTKFLGVHISEDLSWTINTAAVAKKAHQRLYFLRKLRRARAPTPIMTTFYRGAIESILMSCSTVWYGACTASCRKSLQRIVRTAEKIIGTSLPCLQDLHSSRLRSMIGTTPGQCQAEQQRNQALQNAEKLKEAFKEYKTTTSVRLQKVMESESKLKQSLAECDRQKEELEMKFSVLEREKAEHFQTVSRLQEEVQRGKAAAADLRAQAEDVGRKASQLEQQLVERGAEYRELEELRTLARNQEQRVTQSLREAQQNQAELAGLEAILALLHLRESPEGPLCACPCMLPQVDFSGTAHQLKLKPGEGFQQLLRVLQTKEAEMMKQSSLNKRLQERLSRAQEEISSLHNSMTQQALHYQNVHTELLNKVSKATDTEKELKRKSARVAALEKQLQEKTSAYSLAALKNTELETLLQEKTSALQQYQSLMTKKQREYQESLEKCRQSHSNQLIEQQHRIEMLQLSMEQARSRLLEMEQELSSLHKEREEAQQAAFLLHTSLDQLTQEKEVEVQHKQELLQTFKEQASESATKITELQSCLSACREELDVYRQQMEDMKKNYETELQKKNDKVSFLQEKLHSTSVVCQSSSEQNLQLQVSLQQQQAMLTESTARVSELEESQSQLEKQVSSLEQQLERARVSLQDEVRSREQDTQMTSKKLQEMKQQNSALSQSLRHLTSEMQMCRAELVSKESELEHLRRDVSMKMAQIGDLEESLQHAKSQLITKSSLVGDLEEKLRRCETDRISCAQKVQTLEGQSHFVQAELTDTLERFQELKDVLQKTQTISEERQAQVDKLTGQLSEVQRELEERTLEALDMDIALKERQGELQQRAKLLSQLDVAIRDHKQEMEKKVEALQQKMEAKESELRDAQRESMNRNTKESQDLKQQLCETQQKLQNILEKLEESHRRCEALTEALDAAKLQSGETEAQLFSVEEELTLKEAQWQQEEARLQSMVTALEQELELEKEQHSKELECLQQSRGQLLKVSEQISSTMRSSQEQLTVQLQQSQTQLEEAKAHYNQIKAQLDQSKTELDYTRNQASHLQAQLDQTQNQFLQNKTQLEQSRTLYEQMRVQNGHLRAQLEQLTAQFSESRMQVAQLQIQLRASEKSVETSAGSLLNKESDTTRLQDKLFSLGGAAEQQNLFNQTLPLPALHMFTEPLEPRPSPPSPPKQLQPSLGPPDHAVHPCSLTRCTQPAHPCPQPSSALQLSGGPPACDCLQSSSINSSLDLPWSLKATVREVLNNRPWKSSSPSISLFPETVDHSWQGLSAAETTLLSDLSFNPLTYMVDKQDNTESSMEAVLVQEAERREPVSATMGQEEDVDVTSLTGMLKFVNQTLAMQEDPSVWSSTEQGQT